jgi:uncharacterized protein
MDLSASQIILTGLLVGAAAGFLMHRADFCFAGAFRDVFLFRRTFMLRALVLLVVVSMVLFDLARRLQLLPFYPFPLLGGASAASLIGGVLFGIGMVVAGGCAVGTLYRSGAGNVPAMMAVVGLVLGSALYAEFHPVWSAFARPGAYFAARPTLPILLGVDPTWLVAIVCLPASFVIYRWGRAGQLFRRTPVEGYVQPWIVAIALALLGLVSYLVAGMPMGITTSYAKVAAWLESWLAPSHYAGVAYFKETPLDVSFPAGLRICGGPGAGFDGIAWIQFPLIVGILAGSFLSAVSLREFRISFRVPVGQLAAGLAGGILMGLASRMAPGCNVWHVMGGLPIFSLSSILFVAGLFPGAWAGSRIVNRIV